MLMLNILFFTHLLHFELFGLLKIDERLFEPMGGALILLLMMFGFRKLNGHRHLDENQK
jgi:hypothetical protein